MILHIERHSNMYISENMMKRKLQDNTTQDQVQNWCLIVDGTTLTSIFLPTNRAETVPLLRKLAKDCSSVICCRMSPLQKAEIIAMMKGQFLIKKDLSTIRASY